MASKRKANSSAHIAGRRAFEAFCKSQLHQADLAIRDTTGALGKMREWGSLDWSASYTANFVAGWEKARADAEQGYKADTTKAAP